MVMLMVFIYPHKYTLTVIHPKLLLSIFLCFRFHKLICTKWISIMDQQIKCRAYIRLWQFPKHLVNRCQLFFQPGFPHKFFYL